MCIPVRIYIASYAKTATNKNLKLLGYLMLAIGVSFMYLYATGKRKVGIETQGDVIWWNNLRPLHGLLNMLFAYYAINGNNKAYEFLYFDIAVGLVAFLWYHHIAGNFKKLI